MIDLRFSRLPIGTGAGFNGDDGFGVDGRTPKLRRFCERFLSLSSRSWYPASACDVIVVLRPAGAVAGAAA